jgi:hypothetical protein
LIAVSLVLGGAVAGWYLRGIEPPGSSAQPSTGVSDLRGIEPPGTSAQPATGESDVGELPLYDTLRADLRVGDCYNLTGDLGDLVKEVPCTTKHEYEVIYVWALT